MKFLYEIIKLTIYLLAGFARTIAGYVFWNVLTTSSTFDLKTIAFLILMAYICSLNLNIKTEE